MSKETDADAALGITAKMTAFLRAASMAGDAGYAVPKLDKRQASMARAYQFGEVFDIGRHRRFVINQEGRAALSALQGGVAAGSTPDME